MWYLIVSTPDLCTLTYFHRIICQFRNLRLTFIGLYASSDYTRVQDFEADFYRIICEFRILRLTFIESQSQSIHPCLQFPIAITHRIHHPYPNLPYITRHLSLSYQNTSLPPVNDADTSCQFSCQYKTQVQIGN